MYTYVNINVDGDPALAAAERDGKCKRREYEVEETCRADPSRLSSSRDEIPGYRSNQEDGELILCFQSCFIVVINDNNMELEY